jgi:hypothetical protein
MINDFGTATLLVFRNSGFYIPLIYSKGRQKSLTLLALLIYTILLPLCFFSCEKNLPPDTHEFNLDIHEASVFNIDDGFKIADIEQSYPGETVYGMNDFEYFADRAEEWSRMSGSKAEYGMAAFVISFDMYYTAKDDRVWQLYRNKKDSNRAFYRSLAGCMFLGGLFNSNSPPNPSSITSYIKIESVDRKNRIIKNCTLIGVIDKFYLMRGVAIAYNNESVYRHLFDSWDGFEKTDKNEYDLDIPLNTDRLAFEENPELAAIQEILSRYNSEIKINTLLKKDLPDLIYELGNNQYFIDNRSRYADFILETGFYQLLLRTMYNDYTEKLYAGKEDVYVYQKSPGYRNGGIDGESLLLCMFKISKLKKQSLLSQMALDVFYEYVKQWGEAYQGDGDREFFPMLGFIPVYMDDPSLCRRLYPSSSLLLEFENCSSEFKITVAQTPGITKYHWKSILYTIAEYNNYFTGFKPKHPRNKGYLFVNNNVGDPFKRKTNSELFKYIQNDYFNPHDARLLIYETTSYLYIGEYTLESSSTPVKVYSKKTEILVRDLTSGKALYTASFAPESSERYTVFPHEVRGGIYIDERARVNNTEVMKAINEL